MSTKHAFCDYLDGLSAADNDASGQCFPEDPHAGCITLEALCPECRAGFEAMMAEQDQHPAA
jgi:hypothetical protein